MTGSVLSLHGVVLN